MMAMRGWMVLAGAGLAIAGCSRNDAASTNVAAPAPAATNGSATAGTGSFRPPTTTSRLDYGSRMERRFRRLDVNQDSKLTAAEFPNNRGARMLKRLDKNGNAAIDATEWSEGMLARFDQRDANRDGSLTSDERGGRGERGGRRRERLGGMDDETDEVDNGF